MPNFKDDQDEANWLDKMEGFCQENGDYLRSKYSGLRWATEKARTFDQMAEYFKEKREEIDADSETGEDDTQRLKPLDFSTGEDDEGDPF